MLAKRIIPCLDIKDGRVVKGVNFVGLRDAGDPVDQARLYDQAGADELVFLDISATPEGRATVAPMVRRVADEVFLPLTVGGGIRTVEDMRRILLAGADKVSVNSAAVRNPELLTAGAERFGAQCVVLAMDAKRVERGARSEGWGARSEGRGARSEERGARSEERGAGSEERGARSEGRGARSEGRGARSEGRGARSEGRGAGSDLRQLRWEVVVDGGRTPTGIDAVEWAQRAVALGAGEILLTSIDADGTQAGYDLELTRTIAAVVNVPVIASGGAGSLAHFADVLDAGKADAALAASLFHDGVLTIGQVKAYCAERGLPMRIVS